MLRSRLRSMIQDEDGSAIVEIGVFLALFFLAGVGFLCFSARQFQGEFMRR